MNRIWNKILLAAAATVITAGSAHAGPIYSYNWSVGDEGHACNAGGVINWVNAEFDTNTNHLKWYTNLGDHTRLRTDGFTLALTPGGQGLRENETAMLYFDGKTPSFSPDERPALTAYSYNGSTVSNRPGSSSYYDGQSRAGMQDPDRIASSLEDSPNWIYDLTCEVNADGSRTMGFEIDVAPLIGHANLYPSPSGATWNPAPFAETLGLWMGTYTGLGTKYEDGYLTNWSSSRTGYLQANSLSAEDDSVPPADPVPEPATLALLGLGIVGLIGSRRRKCKTA